MADASSSRASWYELRPDGRRHVIPYEHEFSCHTKGRWVGRTLSDVLMDEFPDEFGTLAAVEAAAAAGRLLVNGGAADASAAFAHGDKLTHFVQRSEPSVPATPLEILLTSDDLLAINKPAGIPVHHAGRYRRNSLVEILRFERPDFALRGGDRDGLHVLHRLDRQVSGVLLLPRTAAYLDESTKPIPLDTTKGQALLSECDEADKLSYAQLWPHFKPQVNRTYCGLASMAMVLRAAAAWVGHADTGTEESDVAAALQADGPPSLLQSIGQKGLCLKEMSQIVLPALSGYDHPYRMCRGYGWLEHDSGGGENGLALKTTWARGQQTMSGEHPLAAQEVAAAEEALASLRDAMRRRSRRAQEQQQEYEQDGRIPSMSPTPSAVLVNYHMTTAGQRPFGGHFSPLAAYHAPSGRFLVLDVWPDTGPCWLNGRFLWAAMASTDPDSGHSRGWVEIGHD